ncbi:MAG: NUDIX hydrolase, partial [Lachnospiraceae bacterium]|nr:NUDIX hydrolase [Lachnospiraceae bacterium]
MNDVKRIGRVLKHHGVLLDFYEDEVLLPNGNTAKWDYLKHGKAAAAVAVAEDGRLLMVRQYRGPVDRMTLEIPAGCAGDENEPLEICAARELEEETGYRPGKMQHLLDIYPAFSYCDEMIGI